MLVSFNFASHNFTCDEYDLYDDEIGERKGMDMI